MDSLTVAEPRRNRLICCDGDQDDPVDAEKLAQLLRGGYVKGVHQTEALAETVFKQLVAQYVRRVRTWTRLGVFAAPRRCGNIWALGWTAVTPAPAVNS